MFHPPVVLEKGNVVAEGLNSQHAAELIVHLDAAGTHVVWQAVAFLTGRKLRAKFTIVTRMEAFAQKHGHVVRFDGVREPEDQTATLGNAREQALPATGSLGLGSSTQYNRHANCMIGSSHQPKGLPESRRPTAYIFSTTEIPSRSSPLSIVRAVKSQSSRRLRRSCWLSALSTGQYSKNVE